MLPTLQQRVLHTSCAYNVNSCAYNTMCGWCPCFILDAGIRVEQWKNCRVEKLHHRTGGAWPHLLVPTVPTVPTVAGFVLHMREVHACED